MSCNFRIVRFSMPIAAVRTTSLAVPISFVDATVWSVVITTSKEKNLIYQVPVTFHRHRGAHPKTWHGWAPFGKMRWMQIRKRSYRGAVVARTRGLYLIKVFAGFEKVSVNDEVVAPTAKSAELISTYALPIGAA